MDAPNPELQTQFDEFDSNGDGRLDAREFVELIDSLGATSNAELIRVAFSALDLNGDGYIDFDEFSVWWESRAEDLA